MFRRNLIPIWIGLLSLFQCFSFEAFAAGSALPRGLSGELEPLSSVHQIVMQPVEESSLLEEDALREQQGVAPRYGIPFSSDYTPWDVGRWETITNGERVWRVRVQSKGASSLNFGFAPYHMPAGGRLFVYSPDGSSIRGPFTDEDNEAHRELWTPVVHGDEAVIELSIPARMVPFLRLRLSSINHGYKEFWLPKTELSGSCNVDVICPEGDDWRDESRSVGVISTGGYLFCSGFMVNNTDEDLTPYFMTAKHCGVTKSNAASLVVYWNYETSTCSGSPDGTLDQFQTGSKFRAAREASDFTLVELDDNPNPAFNVHWAGWDNSDTDPTRGTAIHHPNTDEKRISFEYDPLTTTSYIDELVPGDGTHLRVADWDLGATAVGSSGSGLWNQDHRIVGQLHGGFSACGNDYADWYGRFSVSWDAGLTRRARLKDWLDPGDTGAVTLDGRDPCPRPDADFTINPNPGVVGVPVQLTSSVSGGTPPYTYAWDVDEDGTTDYTTADPNHIYTALFNGNVQLTVTDSHPCASSRTHHLAVCPEGEDCTCTDNDWDGFGNPASPWCPHPMLDCDDSNRNVNPGISENCTNGFDDDCDGLVDDADFDCGGYLGTASAEASAYGERSLNTSGSFNALALLLVPVGAIVLLRIWRKKK